MSTEGSDPGALTAGSEKRQSVREFLNQKAPKTAADKAIVIAYYLEKFEINTSFTTDELMAAFLQAKEAPPGNPSDLLYQNAKRGLVMEASQKKGRQKAYVLTNSGEKFVEAGFAPLPGPAGQTAGAPALSGHPGPRGGATGATRVSINVSDLIGEMRSLRQAVVLLASGVSDLTRSMNQVTGTIRASRQTDSIGTPAQAGDSP